jgi:hypothetical protein
LGIKFPSFDLKVVGNLVQDYGRPGVGRFSAQVVLRRERAQLL